MIAYSFFTLFAALTAVYMLFLFRLHAGLRFLGKDASGQEARSQENSAQDAPETTAPSALPQVSVLVPMRNEASALPHCLAALAAQEYPEQRMEVLLIDDHSTDGTAKIAAAAITGDARFRVLRCTEGEAGKKDAITRGVAEARGDVIVTTDADCVFAPQWLRSMLHPFADGADVVAGPVVFSSRDSFFARLQALEFLGLVGVGAGFFGIGYPRLCNGANFAYRREPFDAAGGYDGNRDVHSGDDAFLLHDIVYRQGGRAAFVTDGAAVVRTEAAASVREFLRQRIRWASKTRSYEDSRFVSFLVLLFVYFLFAAAAPFVSVTSTAALLAGVLFFLLKLTADARVLLATAALFRQPLRIPDLLAAEFLHAYYIVVVSFLGFFGTFSWKNRNVKNRSARKP